MKWYYVYIDYRKDTNTPIYVGKGGLSRVRQLARTNRHHSFIRNKVGITRTIVLSTPFEKIALINEALLIETLGAKYQLVNVVKGLQGETSLVTKVVKRSVSAIITQNATRNWQANAKARQLPIVCLETGLEFESISHAARELGITRQNINAVLKHKLKRAGGLSFTYARYYKHEET